MDISVPSGVDSLFENLSFVNPLRSNAIALCDSPSRGMRMPPRKSLSPSFYSESVYFFNQQILIWWSRDHIHLILVGIRYCLIAMIRLFTKQSMTLDRLTIVKTYLIQRVFNVVNYVASVLDNHARQYRTSVGYCRRVSWQHVYLVIL